MSGMVLLGNRLDGNWEKNGCPNLSVDIIDVFSVQCFIVVAKLYSSPTYICVEF